MNIKSFNPWPITIFFILIILLILFLVPIFGVLLAAFKTTRDIAFGNLWSLPNKLYFGNFIEIYNNPSVYYYFLNTILVTIPASIASTTLGVLAGYVFAKLPFKYSNILFLIIISGMFFPPQVILIPLYRLFNTLGLIDTLYPLIIVHTALGIPICTLLMRNFFSTIPTSLREAAKADGANELSILLLIMLPISIPALAVLLTLQFTWIWNDFIWPLILIQTDTNKTIMLGIVNLRGMYSVAWGVQAALSLIASLPTLIVFLFFQNYFIKGITMGAVKG